MKRIINFLRFNSSKKIFFAIINLILLQFFLIFKKKFVIKNIHNYKMILPCNDLGISNELIKYQEREMDQKFIIDSFLKRKMTVYDIGANLGYYSCMMSGRVEPKGKIISFEPIRQNISILEKNIKLNKLKNIQFFNLALSNKNQTRKMYQSKKSNLNTFNKIKNSKVEFHDSKITVNSITIERAYSLCKVLPDFIRMDIEGHEVEVLDSFFNFFKKFNIFPIITFEVHRLHYKNNPISKSLNKLFSLGYKVKMISSSQTSGSKIIENLNYQSIKTIYTDSCERKIYINISPKDLINFLEKTGGVRSVCLEI